MRALIALAVLLAAGCGAPSGQDLCSMKCDGPCTWTIDPSCAHFCAEGMKELAVSPECRAQLELVYQCEIDNAPEDARIPVTVGREQLMLPNPNFDPSTVCREIDLAADNACYYADRSPKFDVSACTEKELHSFL